MPQQAAAPMEKTTCYTIFMLVKTTPRWLTMPIAERTQFIHTELVPLLKQWPDVRMRYFDAEFFTARCSDVIVWETTNLTSYQSLIEGLRDTLYWDTYFEILEIIPAVEENLAELYS